MTIDSADRERLLTELDQTFIVEAGAGTGKTTVLVGRIVMLVAAGRVTMEELAAITFTEAAAAELRDRVREGLEKAAANAELTVDERRRCLEALEEIDLAAIQTIHAFAAGLLRSYPLEAGLPPGLVQLDEIEQDVLFDERFRAWFWGDVLAPPRLRGRRSHLHRSSRCPRCSLLLPPHRHLTLNPSARRHSSSTVIPSRPIPGLRATDNRRVTGQKKQTGTGSSDRRGVSHLDRGGTVPVLPVCLVEPVWVQCSALLPERPLVSPTHPLGCHRPRLPARVVFEHVIAALVHGAGYERIASPGCSDATMRRRLKEWAAVGVSEQGQTLALQADARRIGLDLDALAVDGCIPKAPGGGEAAGRAPVDRGKQGRKRSSVTDGVGIPLHGVSAGANRHDRPLLAPTLAGLDKLDGLPDAVTVPLERGYDSNTTRALLAALGFDGAIARQGVPAPIQAGSRWVVERARRWLNSYGKLRRCTQQLRPVVDFYRFLAAALVVIRQLIQRARRRYRWPSRPTARRLK